MTIETLIKVAPPPSQPTFVFEGPWEPIEAELGTSLPQDYKDLVKTYGHGQFLQFIDIYTPASPSLGSRLIPEVYVVQKFFLEDQPQVRMYPQPGGLLACGSTDNGEYILWLTRGPPEEWPIVVWDHDCEEGEELELFECDLTDYVAGIVTGEIKPRTLPEGMEQEEGEQVFSPSSASEEFDDDWGGY